MSERRKNKKSFTTEAEIPGSRLSGLRMLLTGESQTRTVKVSYGSVGRREHINREDKGIVFSSGYTNKLPHPAYMKDYENLNRDGEVEAAITMLTDMLVGVGFHTEMPDGKEHPNLKKINDYNEAIDLDGTLKQMARVRYEKGFCPIERIDNDEFKILPPETIFIYRTPKGKVEKYSQEVNGSEIASWKPEDEEIFLFKHKETPNHPYGKALVECIMERIDIRREMSRDIPDVIHKMGYPFRVWRADTTDIMDVVFPAATEKDVDEDVFIEGVMKDQLEIHKEETTPRVPFTDFVIHNDEQIAEGLNAPLLLYLRNATEASATTILEAIDRRIQSEQLQLEREIEKWIFKRVTGDPVPRLIWGAPKTGVEDITLTDVAELFTSGAITFEQAQALMKELGVPLVDIPETPAVRAPGVPPGKDGDPDITLNPDYEVALRIVKDNFNQKTISLTEALKEGGRVIKVAVEKNRLQSINRLSKTLGRQVTKLSAESERFYELMETELFEGFRESLLPSIKSKIEGRPASYHVIPQYK